MPRYSLSEGQQAALTLGVLAAVGVTMLGAAYAEGKIKQAASSGATTGVKNQVCSAPVFGGILQLTGNC